MAITTTVEIRVPKPLRECCRGARSVAVEARDVRGALAELEGRFPALHRSICDETGSLRPHIGLFVNSSHVRDRGGLDTPLAPGDVVSIFTAVSGG